MSRAAGRFAWSTALIAVALDLLVVPFIVANRDVPIAGYIGTPIGQVALSFLGIAIALLGALVAARHPANLIGWIFLVSASCLALGRLAANYVIYDRFSAVGLLPAGDFMTWIAYVLVLISSIAMVFVVILFPDGRPPSPRWTPVVMAAALSATILVIGSALRPGTFDTPYGSVANPYGLAGDAGTAMSVLELIGEASALVFALLGAFAIVARFRSARGAERQQLKFVAYPWALLSIYSPFFYAWSSSSPFGEGLRFLDVVIAAVGVSLVAGVPIAAGLAILRYRLYDIDLLINRTLVYGVTSAAIALTFYLGLVALQPLLRALTSGSEIAVAAATLVSFALFQPVRRRVQEAVDRRFDRPRYDAAHTLELFADRLREEVDLDALRGDLLAAVRGTMSPAHASLWLRERAG